MLRKIISIKNVGRFLNSAAAGNPELSHCTLIAGANGFGKTTLCSIFRSLKTGNPAYIVGRRTLGIEDQPTVEMLLPENQVRFDNNTWTTTHPHLVIYDSTFISENIHSGEVVEIEHRRNLFQVIIGEEGVRLGKEDSTLARQSRDLTGEITETTKAINPHIPRGMSLDTFLALPADQEIDERITEQEHILNAVSQAQLIHDRAPLSEIKIANLPEGIGELLGHTIAHIEQDVEARLNTHLAAHNMEAGGSSWLAKGLEHTNGETCPFCGQNIRGLPLVAAYRSIFSDRYKALKRDIADMYDQIDEQFGDGAVGHLKTCIERNRGTIEFWSQYCRFDATTLAVSDEVPDAIYSFRQAALALLNCKGLAPLESIKPDEALDNAIVSYNAALAQVEEINRAIRTVNNLIAAKKAETGATNVQAEEIKLAYHKATKIRHTASVAKKCTRYLQLNDQKARVDQDRVVVRGQLDTHTRMAIKPYKQRLNHYLDVFNAGFQITETRHGYPSGIAASSYRLVINNTTFDLGSGNTPPDFPSFKNTLSSGDRSTLALAFFLTHLEQDQSLATKTVVFDDPFSSQDTFRRLQTVHEITRLGQSCDQIIVLSHDVTFLKQVWDKAPADERVALSLANHGLQGTKIMPLDIERACQGRTATDIDDLLTYLNKGKGELVDLIRKMRVVLETHCWTTYPSWFNADQDWLGEIVRKIREGGDQHPAYDLYDELDQINDYSKNYHHGEGNANASPDQIDPQELAGYIKRTLRIVNALQA